MMPYFHTIQSILKPYVFNVGVIRHPNFHTIQSILKLFAKLFVASINFGFPYYSVYFKA